MTKVRIVGGVLLCALFGIGIYSVRGRKHNDIFDYGSSVWRTTKDLPAQHQIRTGDLTAPSSFFEMAGPSVQQVPSGWYLLVAKKRGDLVGQEDIADMPPLPGKSRLPIIMYSSKDQDAFISALEPGVFLKFCSVVELGAKEKVKPHCTCATRAVVVHRATTASDSSWVGLEVPRQQLPNIFAILAKPAKPLVISESELAQPRKRR